MLARFRLRLLGLGMLVVVALLLSISIGMYRKDIPGLYPTVQASVDVQRSGLQMIVPADVKVRGRIVGEVRKMTAHGDYVTLHMYLNPDDAKMIPGNVSAQILPKTLFGEKFVNLVIPSAPSSRHLAKGDNVPLDRSKNAVEAEQVFNDLVPLLQALQPVQLNIALSNLAQALSGRGTALGQNLVNSDVYFQQFNPNIGRLQTDISGLADLATNVNAAAPDLLSMFNHFADTSATLSQCGTKSSCNGTGNGNAFDAFLRASSGFAATATTVLGESETSIVAAATTPTRILASLARYSPEFPCLFDMLDAIEPLVDQTFGWDQTLNGGKGGWIPGRGPGFYIRLSAVSQPPGYVYPKDSPSVFIDNGPNCYGYPPPNFSTAVAPAPPVDSPSKTMGTASLNGSPVTTARVLAAPYLGVDSNRVPDSISMLMAPQLQGQQVSLQ